MLHFWGKKSYARNISSFAIELSKLREKIRGMILLHWRFILFSIQKQSRRENKKQNRFYDSFKKLAAILEFLLS